MSTLINTNKTHLQAFKTAVKLDREWTDVSLQIYDKIDILYSPDHLSRVFSGKRRPSYKLAECLSRIANINIRKIARDPEKVDSQFRKVGSYKEFTLRRLPFAHYSGNTHQYFETTPEREYEFPMFLLSSADSILADLMPV